MGEDGLGDRVFLGTKDPLGLAAGVDLTLAGLLKLPFEEIFQSRHTGDHAILYTPYHTPPSALNQTH